MTWQEVRDDPALQNLPYKIELDQFGRIVMSPASNLHGDTQSRLIVFLAKHIRGGRTTSECSIQTSLSVKVADVAWRSDNFMKKYKPVTPYNVAPEICIEIISPSNSAIKIQEKTVLYLGQGAQEVWTCTEEGVMEFFDCSGRLVKSKLAPKFPSRIWGRN